MNPLKRIIFIFLFGFFLNAVCGQTLIAEYNFDGDLLDELNGSVLDKFDATNDGYNHNNAVTAFGTDTYGTYWTWTSTLARGGGLWIDVNTDISQSYSIGVRFSLQNTESGYRKIIDYKNLTSDNGFYFYSGGKLNFYPYGTLGSSVTANNQVVDIITTRNGATNQFIAYIVVDNVLIQELDVSDASGYAKPTLVNGKPRFRFFHDDNVTSTEASPGGKVYSIKVWDGPITNIVGALNNTWTGSANNEWNNPLNWSKALVPDINDNVEIPVGTNAPVISAGDNAYCDDLTISSGAILTIGNGGSIITAGNITNHGTFQYQKSFADNIWNTISIPINSATANTFLGDFLQSYTEATDTWNQIIDPETPLNPGIGYALWSSAKGAYTFTGNPNTGDMLVSFTYTPGGNPNHYGFNLIGNPYPSAINWDLLNETYGAVYHWDGSAYQTWNGSGAGSQYILPMEGFMICPGTSGTITFSNAHRTHPMSAKSWQPGEQIILQAANNNYQDALYIIFNANASADFDLQYDAWKILSTEPGIPQLFTLSDQKRLSIDQQPKTNVLPLGFACTEGGTYTIDAVENNFAGHLFLEDRLSGYTHNLTLSSYAFAWNPGENEHRFNLHFSPVGVPENYIHDVMIYPEGNKLVVKTEMPRSMGLFIYDLLGKQLLKKEINAPVYKCPLNLERGLYLVKITDGTRTKTQKVFIN